MELASMSMDNRALDASKEMGNAVPVNTNQDKMINAAKPHIMVDETATATANEKKAIIADGVL
jgi:hypothetical protein